MRYLIAVAVSISMGVGFSAHTADNAGTVPVRSEFSQVALLLYQKQVDKAIEQFQILAARDTKAAGVHHDLACAYALKGQYDKAISEFKKALELETTPFKAVMFYNESVVYLAHNMPQESALAIEEAIKINPGLTQHENVVSIKNYAEVTSAQPTFVLSYDASSLELPDTVYYAQKNQRLGQEDIYAFELSKALPEFFYKSRAAFVFIGTGYFFEKKYSEAKEQFLSALAIEDDFGTFDAHEKFLAHYYLGSIEEVSGNHRAAVQHFEEASELDPDNIPCLRDLAWAYFLNREYLKARDTCDRALELHPEPQDAKRIKEIFDTINKDYMQ